MWNEIEREENKDKDMKEVDNGGYNVHPVPLPNSEIKERIRKRYEDCCRSEPCLQPCPHISHLDITFIK